jgi:predicted TIM-barrel fold metal-dependent hydrolase
MAPLVDLSGVPVIDNHCHPLASEQPQDASGWRLYFSPTHESDVAEHQLPYALFYRWAVRQLASFLEVEASEEAILAARVRQPFGEYTRRLAHHANITGLVLDDGYPGGPGAYTAAETANLFGVKHARLLRLETRIQDLARDTQSFAAAEEAFRETVRDVHAAGYTGLKSIAAYRTGLEVAPVPREEAARAFASVQAEARERGTVRLASKQVVDYFLEIALAEADRQRLPFQFHTGYGDPDVNLLLANPLYLRSVIERYPHASIVLLHESYPYMRQAAFLTMVYPNVYADISTVLPPLNSMEIERSFHQILGIAPASKIMYSSDAHSIPELFWLGPGRARSALETVFGDLIDAGELDASEAVDFARRILHDNAAKLYGLSG